jgi:hypothetical protein
VLMKIPVFWDRMYHWLIPVDKYIPVDMTSNPRWLKSSTNLSIWCKSQNATEK